MPVFNYQARTRTGMIQSGRVEASTIEAAQEILQNSGLLIVALQMAEAAPLFGRSIQIFGGVKGQDIVAFSRQFSTLFKAGVPLVMGLRTLSADWPSPAMRDVIAAVAADVDGGIPLSKALGKHNGVFSDFYIQMVRGGEASGKLGEILAYLADYEERMYHFRSKVRGAMIYPIFILTVFVIIAVLMLLFVVPQLTALLVQSNKELPFSTKLLVGTSSFVKNFWFLLILLTGGGIGGGFWFLRTPEGKETWGIVSLRLPGIGPISRKMYVYRFAESLSLLVHGGVAIVQALPITADTVGNIVYERIVREIEQQVRRGGTIASVMHLHSEFPPLVTQMVRVGEQAGQLDTVLKSVADFYQTEIYASLDTISSLIQPIILVFLGLGVALLVSGILLPIYSFSAL